ncbi:rhomboid-like protein [Mycobacterium sp.]|uniref:rhomboid-like protein n=1 Tax=Mycobacterium sp. TaxID=1785 RepID=UPI0025FB1726|nr:rhomboid-like protein [Mycobacterium sp.]
MILRILSRLSRVRITLGYAAVLIAVSAALAELRPRARAHVIAQASTNLHNLAHGHLATLLDSAFITDAGPMYFWLPCFVCLLALAELIWRSGRLAIVFITGHIGATLLVAAGLTAAVKFHWLPLSVSRASDVGVSYGAVAVLGALTSAIPLRWRPAWIGFWIPVGLAAAVLGEDFTDVGHSVALMLGLLVATRLDGPARWTRVRCALLAVSSVFGFFLLAHGAWSTAGGAAVGAVGALTAELLTRSRAARRRPASDIEPEPVLNS